MPRAKPTVSVSLGGELQDDLASIFEDAYRSAGVAVGRERGVGVALTNATQHAESYARERAGSAISDIDETTEGRVEQIIGNAMRDGLSDRDVADKLARLFGEDRAMLIARTETATAYNLGVVQALKDAGEEYVYVSDGDQYDEECINADGEIWTLEEAEANPLEHPNCQRDFRPLTADELAEVKAEEEQDAKEGFAARLADLEAEVFYSEDQPRVPANETGKA